MAEYLNPWHKLGKPEYGPSVYVTEAEPKPYGGHLIYNRNPAVWDVVKDGICITQRAGPRGARQFIDKITNGV